MRLPQIDGVIDVEQTKVMIDKFVQLQINYADWENPAIQSRASSHPIDCLHNM